MDPAIAELLDKQAIVETINRLFISTDQRDWDSVKACLAGQVLFDMSSMGGGEAKTVTADAIVEAWKAALRPLLAIHHQAGNHLVEVHGERATAFCCGIASHYLPNRSGRNTRVFVGSYDFGLVRVARQWRISEFRFNLKYIEGNKDLEMAGN